MTYGTFAAIDPGITFKAETDMYAANCRALLNSGQSKRDFICFVFQFSLQPCLRP